MGIIFADAYVLGQAPEEDFPLNHARILWRNDALTGMLSATTGEPGTPASAALSPLTFEGWRPATMPAQWQVTWPEPRAINACGIAVHDLAVRNTEVVIEVQEESGGPWEDIANFLPASAAPILILGERRMVTGARLRVIGDQAPFISAIFFGETLDMERPFFAGHAPQRLNEEVITYGRRSERGQGLGFSIERVGDSAQYSWQHLTPGFVRQKFMPFFDHAKKRGYFFIAWNLKRQPQDVAYGVMEGNSPPTNNGNNDRMDVSITVNGLGPTGAPR
jgi:hypothetical protein